MELCPCIARRGQILWPGHISVLASCPAHCLTPPPDPTEQVCDAEGAPIGTLPLLRLEWLSVLVLMGLADECQLEDVGMGRASTTVDCLDCADVPGPASFWVTGEVIPW